MSTVPILFIAYSIHDAPKTQNAGEPVVGGSTGGLRASINYIYELERGTLTAFERPHFPIKLELALKTERRQ